MAQFGVSQIGNEAPLAYKRAVNFLIMAQAPIGGLILTLNGQHVLSDKAALITTAVIGTVASLLKLLQQFIGAEPAQTVTDETGATVAPK